MNLSQVPSELPWKNSSTRWLWISGFAALIFAAHESVALWFSDSRQLWVALPILLATPLYFWLMNKGRPVTGGVLLMAAIAIQAGLTPLVVGGLGVPNAITSAVLIDGIGLATVSRRYRGRVLAVSLIVLITTILIDWLGVSVRPEAQFSLTRWIFVFITSVVFGIAFAREFLLLDLRTKIVIAILGTGGIAIAILISSALFQAGQITNSLTTRLDTSVSQLAEEQLRNSVFIEANKANEEFEDISQEATSLAQTWISLRIQGEALNQTPYWDEAQSLSSWMEDSMATMQLTPLRYSFRREYH